MTSVREDADDIADVVGQVAGVVGITVIIVPGGGVRGIPGITS